MITIDQLLESVDLDFEPRWIAKDNSGLICGYTEKPERGVCSWYDGGNYIHIGYLKLSEFDGKDWTECIYEVPRWDNPDGQILKLQEDSYYNVHLDVLKTINELVDAVNELKGAKND